MSEIIEAIIEECFSDETLRGEGPLKFDTEYVMFSRDEFRSALTRAAEGRWEPIETAPKDGTYVLLKIKYSDNPIVAHFIVSSWSACTEDYETSCGTYCQGGMPVMAKHSKPIGWRSLPTPPTD